MIWKTVAEHTPSSAKVMPVWICDNDKQIDLAYLTDDEKYFVSTDHKRVYPSNSVLWGIIDTPVGCKTQTTEFDSDVDICETSMLDRLGSKVFHQYTQNKFWGEFEND